MAALTKADLAEMLFDELGLNKREAREIVEMFYTETQKNQRSKALQEQKILTISIVQFIINNNRRQTNSIRE